MTKTANKATKFLKDHADELIILVGVFFVCMLISGDNYHKFLRYIPSLVFLMSLLISASISHIYFERRKPMRATGFALITFLRGITFVSRLALDNLGVFSHLTDQQKQVYLNFLLSPRLSSILGVVQVISFLLIYVAIVGNSPQTDDTATISKSIANKIKRL